MGIYADFLYSVNQTRYGTGPLEAMAGPTVGPLLEMGVVQPLNALKAAVDGKPTNLLAQTVQDAKGFLPFSNVWYTKAAFEHLVLHNILEALNPGYLASMRARTRKEYGQEWWWSPGETAPSRSPDFPRAVGE